MPWTPVEEWRLKLEPWRVCRPVVADVLHNDEEQDMDRKNRILISIKMKMRIRIRIKLKEGSE